MLPSCAAAWRFYSSTSESIAPSSVHVVCGGGGAVGGGACAGGVCAVLSGPSLSPDDGTPVLSEALEVACRLVNFPTSACRVELLHA